ncbi:MAG: T9SS type A sorting domain-containing protein, partial [Ignavibacteria bacterium]
AFDNLLDTLGNVDAGSVEICSNDNNYVYAIWKDKRINKYRLFMNYSSNNGTTWQIHDSRVDNDNTPSFNPFEDLEFDCGNSGNVYAAWRAYDGDKWTINFNRSSNHGAGWYSQDLRIDKSPEGVHINAISIVAGNNGFVYGIWCYGVSPDNNVSKLFFNHSSNYGLTWQSTDRRLDNAPSNYHARYANLEIDNSGKVFVVWQQEPFCTPNPCFNMQDIYMNYSLNNGAGWNNSPFRIDDAPDNTAQRQPIITCNNSGNAFVSWRDNRNNPEFGNPLVNYYSVKVNFSLTSLSGNENTIPSYYKLHQNFPNPFNPATKIKFDIPLNLTPSTAKALLVKLVIYDILGSEIVTLLNELLKSGTYEVVWDASKYSSGVYFYKLITDGFVQTKKMLLVK